MTSLYMLIFKYTKGLLHEIEFRKFHHQLFKNMFFIISDKYTDDWFGFQNFSSIKIDIICFLTFWYKKCTFAHINIDINKLQWI